MISTSLKLDFLLLNLRWEKLKPTFYTASCPRLNIHFRCPPDCSNKLTIDWTRAVSFPQIQKLRTKDIDSGRFDVMGRFTSWFIANTYYDYWHMEKAERTLGALFYKDRSPKKSTLMTKSYQPIKIGIYDV